MSLIDLEIGVVLLAIWLATFVVLWKTIDRPGRPGIIKGRLVIEHVMLAHILLFIVTVSELVRGSGIFN
jgi:hypothetical protein